MPEHGAAVPAARHAAIVRRGILAGLAAAFLARSAGRAWALGTRVDAATFNAPSDGRGDATAALSAAARAVPDSGGTLFVGPGRYRITSTILLKPRTELTGPGATIFTADGWARALPGRDGRSPGRALVANMSHGADRISDSDLVVRDINFQYVGEQFGDAHAVRFRQAENILVEGCTFAGGGNGTALLSCRHTEVRRCSAQGTLNCAFDHWEGTSDSLVQDCLAECARGYGIMFTGVGTAPTDHRHATRLRAIGNRITGAKEAGIWVCALSERSSVTEVEIRGNTVRGGLVGAAGIGGTGDVRNMLVEGNEVRGVRGTPALFMRGDEWNRPRGNRIIGNRLTECRVDAPQVALIQALGDDVEVRGNRAEKCQYPALVWVNGARAVLADNAGTTQTGRTKYRNTGTAPMSAADP